MISAQTLSTSPISPSHIATSPTSGWSLAPNAPLFEALLVVATVCVALAAVWRWRSLGLATRVVSVVLVEVLVVLSVMTYVNRANDVVTTWTSMTGSTSGLTPKTLSQSDGTGSFGNGINRWRRTRRMQAKDRAAADRSTITSISIGGGPTGYDLPAQVYLPGSYDEASSAHRSYPVLELLAGFPGSYLSWSTGLRLKHTLDTLIRTGRMPAVIAVMPSQNPFPPADSECVNADPSVHSDSRAETYLTDDVPTYLAQHYRAAKGRINWVIGGYSTGGYCAANLALRHPDRYASAIALSAYFIGLRDDTTGRLFKDRKEFEANSPQFTIAKPHPKLAFFTIHADDNARDGRASRHFVAAIPASDAHLAMATASGGHTPPVWRVGSRQAFIWLAHLLRHQPGYADR